MSNFDTPVARTSLRKEVYERVRGALLSGELTSQDRITETQLAESLGTSRAPVREALRQLEQEGLIEPLGSRGYRVIEPPDIRETSLLRIALEKLAVTLAVERANALDYSDLNEIVSSMRRAVEDGDVRAAYEFDLQFHERMCAAAHHALLLDTWQSMRAQLAIATTAINRSYPDANGLPERHGRLIEILAQGDPALAEAEIERHICAGLESLFAAEG